MAEEGIGIADQVPSVLETERVRAEIHSSLASVVESLEKRSSVGEQQEYPQGQI